MGLFWKSKAEKEAQRLKAETGEPKLVTCIECGGRVSSEANICPHCKNYPKGKSCAVCTQWAKKSEPGVHGWIDTPMDYSGVQTWIHSACYEKVQREFQPVKYTCPLCKHVQTCSNDKRLADPCPSCGHRIPPEYGLGTCYYCGTGLRRLTSVHEGKLTHRFCIESRSQRR